MTSFPKQSYMDGADFTRYFPFDMSLKRLQTQDDSHSSAANRNCQPTNAKVSLFSRRLAQLSFQVAGRLVVSAVMGRPVYVQRNGLANVRLK